MSVFSLDLHVHSRFFHGWGPRPTPFDPLGGRLARRVARAQGLDGLAFTNHDYAWSPESADTTVIPGIEISTTRGHVLVVGPNPPPATKVGGLTPTQAVDLAHERECAAIMAHPFRNGDLPESDAAFDAVEVNGKVSTDREPIEQIAAEHGLPLVGGSDAHYPIEVGRAYTQFEATDRSPAAVAAAIRDGRVNAVRKPGPVGRVLGPAYETIHRRKGHVS